MQEGLSIADASQLIGVSTHTLRYYEKAGLLPAIPRTEGGLRRYRTEDVQLLRFLIRLRQTGMPIRTLRKYSEMVQEGTASYSRRRDLLKQHQSELRQQVAELEKSLTILDLKIQLYEDGFEFGTDAEHPCFTHLQSLLEASPASGTHLEQEKEQQDESTHA
jgi:DNA-binding transcriptional MerR regulator